MLSIDFDDSISEENIFIGGIKCFLYNSKVLASLISEVDEVQKGSHIRVNVLYLVHQRGGDHSYMRGIASKIISEFNKASLIPMVGVSFDCRNHGEREIDNLRNLGWKSKNATHGIDMISCVDGTVQDLKLVMDFLGCYLDLDRFVKPEAKAAGTRVRFHNILAGYSQGGHAVIRFGYQYPENVSVINPNIACSDITTLLINRLRRTKEFDKKLFYSSYEELNLNDTERALYPEAFHELLSSQDMRIFEEYPFKKIDMFATFFSEDPLVPPAISKLWIDMYLNTNLNTEVYYEDGATHDITVTMIDQFIHWLISK